MKKWLLAFALFFSFAVVSRSDPPEGYMYNIYYFNIKNYQGQPICGVTATIDNTTSIDLEESSLVSNCCGNITIYLLVPADPDVPSPLHNNIEVTFSAPGYQDFVYYLGGQTLVSVVLAASH